ncbi:hypothetical protein [Legionella donaldsonii]|nr:hypothetical protein [Legionella donaldsonii]
MDYILLGWQTSQYKLKGSEQKWFMKPYDQIVADTGIPKSTLERYIKELNDAGFIERRQALYSRTKEQGGFEVKKGTYIHITDKLLTLLQSNGTSTVVSPNQTEEPIKETKSAPQECPGDLDNTRPTCKNLEINEGTDSLIMRGSYIRDLYPSSFINTISFKEITCSVDKATLQRLNKQYESIQKWLLTEIKEEIPDSVKKLVLGTFFNLTFEHQKQFSAPAQLAAEYLYALLNIEFYLPKVRCFKHRNNILSKMIRTNHWRTPKGFYKYFYLGQSFQDKLKLREQNWQREKANEIRQGSGLDFCQTDERLIQLEAQMGEKSAMIDELTKRLYQESSEEILFELRNNIQRLRNELESLWHQQFLIEQEDEGGQYLAGAQRCA